MNSGSTNPYVSTQLQAIIEGIRLLESLVTAPLGLYSDIKMLREALPFPEADEVSREEARRRRSAYMSLSDAPQQLALQVISSVSASIDILCNVNGETGPPLEPAWASRADRVLTRAEQRVAGDIRAGKAARIHGVYVIVDPEVTRERPVLEIVESTLRGGTSVLQLRDKVHDKYKVLTLARQLKSLCEEHDALLIVNDDADVAVSCRADGLHVGQSDLPVADARQTLDPQQLVGRSNNTLEEAMASEAQGVDYLAVGAVFATSTMGKTPRPAVGVETIGKVKGLAQQPIVAIGGINSGNVAEVARAGADCVCVVSAVTLADDPERATRELVELFENAK